MERKSLTRLLLLAMYKGSFWDEQPAAVQQGRRRDGLVWSHLSQTAQRCSRVGARAEAIFQPLVTLSTDVHILACVHSTRPFRSSREFAFVRRRQTSISLVPAQSAGAARNFAEPEFPGNKRPTSRTTTARSSNTGGRSLVAHGFPSRQMGKQPLRVCSFSPHMEQLYRRSPSTEQCGEWIHGCLKAALQILTARVRHSRRTSEDPSEIFLATLPVGSSHLTSFRQVLCEEILGPTFLCSRITTSTLLAFFEYTGTTSAGRLQSRGIVHTISKSFGTCLRDHCRARCFSHALLICSNICEIMRPPKNLHHGQLMLTTGHSTTLL